MDNSQEFERSCDISVMLKSKREHFEKQTEKLLNYFGEEFKVVDPLSLIGKRFRDKEEEFSSLRRANQELLLQTKNLADEIQRLRFSQNDSLRWDDPHLSLQRTQRLDNLTVSKQVRSGEDTTNEQIRSRLGKLDLQLNNTRQKYTDYSAEFDQLLQLMFAYLTRDKVAAKLAEEVQQRPKEQDGNEVDKDNGTEEMVVVPRKRYEKLIEIYSINMAEISINQLRQKLSLKPEKEEEGINYIAQAHRTYQQKYSDIVKGEQVDVKDLHQLFKALTKKVGFQKEWERYHMLNANAGVSFKAKVDSILGFTLIREKQDSPSEQKKLIEGLKGSQLVMKLDRLVQNLPFQIDEKTKWKELSNRFNEDRLISIQSMPQRYKEIVEKETEILIRHVTSIIHANITQSLQQFSKIIQKKIKMREVSLERDFEEVNAQSLSRLVQEKMRDSDDVWGALREVSHTKIKQIYKKMGKNFIFISGGALYQALANKK